MKTIRVSATDIDAVRRYRNDDEADFDDLIAQLRRQSEPTEAMLAGTALHKALETAEAGELRGVSVDGYIFDIEASAEIDLPAVREMKGTREYVVSGVLVTLVGKVDAIHGKRVDDHKFTSRYDAERYMDTYQWRIYLDIFGADEFRWNVFEGREVAPQHYVITNFHSLTMHRYPGMEADILGELREFVSFARKHLPERIQEGSDIETLAG